MLLFNRLDSLLTATDCQFKDLVVAERVLYPLGIAALPYAVNAVYLGAKITKLKTKLETELDEVVEKVDRIQVIVSQLYLLKSSKRAMSEKMLVRNGPCWQTQ